MKDFKFLKQGQVSEASVEVSFNDGEPSEISNVTSKDIQFHPETGNAFVQITLALPINEDGAGDKSAVIFSDANGNKMTMYARKTR